MDKKGKPSIMITTYASNGQLCDSTSQLIKENDQQSTDLFRGIRKYSSRCGFKLQSNCLPELNQIKGPSGSVRGHKDVVKKSLENIKVVALHSQRDFTLSNLPTFTPLISSSSNEINSSPKRLNSISNNISQTTIQQIDELYKQNYLDKLFESEQNLCVIYTTTLGIIRRTFEDSNLMKSILDLNLIKYEERDIYLNQEYKYQLRLRCKPFIQIPVLFVDGYHLGGIKEIELLNENGKLSIQLAKFKMNKAPKEVCHCCGNAKFIACQSCNGSRKSTVHHFKFNSIALRCIKCDKNDGLIQCPMCCSTVDNNNNDIV